MPPSSADFSPQELYPAETARIRQEFERTGDGRAAVLRRAALVDLIVEHLHRQWIFPERGGPEGFGLVALGGYGRRALFPYSDVDLLFLAENKRTEEAHRKAIAAVSRALWDLPVRLSPASRTLEECDVLDRDNLEFSISLLDCRYLTGDAGLFAQLRERVLPQLIARERQEIVHTLAELTRRRHAKHGDTIFELEPNLKEAPGGLRDYQLAGWLALIAELDASRRWTTPEGLWPAPLAGECGRAFDFLSAARCFLHYRQKRDFNQLTYELQAEAAAKGIGHPAGPPPTAAEWMRGYFRHARSIHRLATQLLDEAAASRSSLYGAFLDWRSRLSNADFTVARGRIFLRQPAVVREPGGLLALFEFMARHSLALSAEAERAVEQALPGLPAAQFRAVLWPRLREILTLPAAAAALRAMHRLGALVHLFPEFRAIDSLVVRDFYHRYTVDEHSFQTIENLHRLGSAEGEWERRFAEILAELEQPELLYFSLLFHDVGKGMPAADHIQGSLQAAAAIASRLGTLAAESEEIRFLITDHLRMSATLQRRDIFEPETVRSFAEAVGTPERLKMLCLFTYADVRAVTPEALTPWKAEMLWRLYASTSNVLARSLDEDRFRADVAQAEQLERVRALLPRAAKPQELGAFLEGFPRRYLATRPPDEIAAHYQMARRLAKAPVQLRLRPRPHDYELTVLTADRPFLFASLTGVLTAWGMNILKAEAFANRAGTVLDTFRFVDPHRTLELNPPEAERLERTLVDVLAGRTGLDALLSGRMNPAALPAAKIRIPTQLRFDDGCSARSTLLELMTQDRPGLLYQMSTVIAELGCNIEVALIDTEGQKVIDVFYLTAQGGKLDAGRQQVLRDALLRLL